MPLRDKEQSTTGWEIQEGFLWKASPLLIISIDYPHHSSRRKALVALHILLFFLKLKEIE